MIAADRFRHWARQLGHQGPLIAGHRGDPRHELENTLPSLCAAAGMRVAVEMDVRLSADQVPVVFHDARLSRLVDDPRAVGEVPWSELALLTLRRSDHPGRSGRIPRLSEVVAAISPDIPLFVEIKCEGGGHAAQAVVAAAMTVLGDRRADSYAVMSFNPWVVMALRRRFPRVLRGYLYETYAHVVLPTWQKWLLRQRVLGPWMRPDFWGPNVELVHAHQVERDRRRGRATVVWTADSDAERNRVRAAGADVLITNDPETALAML